MLAASLARKHKLIERLCQKMIKVERDRGGYPKSFSDSMGTHRCTHKCTYIHPCNYQLHPSNACCLSPPPPQRACVEHHTGQDSLSVLRVHHLSHPQSHPSSSGSIMIKAGGINSLGLVVQPSPNKESLGLRHDSHSIKFCSTNLCNHSC